MTLTMSLRAGRWLNHRAFSTARPLLQSPHEILEKGFQRMQQPGYKRSDADRQRLVEAGKQAGLNELEVAQLYQNVAIGRPEASALSPEARSAAFRAEAEVLENPSLDTPFEYDDLAPMGHIQLHLHRLQRDYNRVAAYDLPQLAKYVQPYRPPDSQTDVLQFSHTSYMGEDHDAERRVTVTLKTARLNLSKDERHKLRLLARQRYNPTTDELRISSSRFPDQTQNKRFVAQLVSDLIAEAKTGDDKFVDVPLDTRHVEPRIRRNKARYPNHQFPMAWARPEDAPKKRDDLVSVLTE